MAGTAEGKAATKHAVAIIGVIMKAYNSTRNFGRTQMVDPRQRSSSTLPGKPSKSCIIGVFVIQHSGLGEFMWHLACAGDLECHLTHTERPKPSHWNPESRAVASGLGTKSGIYALPSGAEIRRFWGVYLCRSLTHLAICGTTDLRMCAYIHYFCRNTSTHTHNQYIYIYI